MKTNYVVPTLNRYILGRITSGKDEEEYVKFGLYARSMRVRLRLSREKLSDMTDIDRLKLSAIESNLLTISDLAPEELSHLEESLGITYHEFLVTWYEQLTSPKSEAQLADPGGMNHADHATCNKTEPHIVSYTINKSEEAEDASTLATYLTYHHTKHSQPLEETPTAWLAAVNY